MSDCPTDNDFDGRMGVRISAIFVILVGSFLGTWFPVFAARNPGVGVPSWAFFIAKYFGSGVILATAFIHVCHFWHSWWCQNSMTDNFTAAGTCQRSIDR